MTDVGLCLEGVEPYFSDVKAALLEEMAGTGEAGWQIVTRIVREYFDVRKVPEPGSQLVEDLYDMWAGAQAAE